jgi:hypothetical protein
VYRDYDISVLERVEQIRQMQQLGFELKEMKPFAASDCLAAKNWPTATFDKLGAMFIHRHRI